jgi:hypothetical protein
VMQPVQAHDILGFALAAVAFDGASNSLRFASTLPPARWIARGLGQLSWVNNSLMAIPLTFAPMLPYTSFILSTASGIAARAILGRISSNMFLSMEDYDETVALVRSTAAVVGQLVIAGSLWTSIRQLATRIRRGKLRRLRYHQAVGSSGAAPNSVAVERVYALEEQADSLNWMTENAALRTDAIVNTPNMWLASALRLVWKLILPLMIFLMFLDVL